MQDIDFTAALLYTTKTGITAVTLFADESRGDISALPIAAYTSEDMVGCLVRGLSATAVMPGSDRWDFPSY